MKSLGKQERWLVVVLRWIGSVSLLAAGAVFLPYEWMDRIHQSVGLGILPDEPIVGYLARTLSAFYTLMGGLLWVLSFDPRHHRRVIRYLGTAFMLFGVTALWVDILEGMPMFWTIGEGPIVITFGILMLALSRDGPTNNGGPA